MKNSFICMLMFKKPGYCPDFMMARSNDMGTWLKTKFGAMVEYERKEDGMKLARWLSDL